MDRNSIIGLILIGAILFGYSIFMQPSEEQIAEKRKQDSITLANETTKRQAEEIAAQAREKEAAEDTTIATLPGDTTDQSKVDSLQAIKRQIEFGSFSKASEGNKELLVLENDKVKITISTKGGQIVSAELKEYHTYDSTPLLLFDEAHSEFNIGFYISRGKTLNTADLFFEAQPIQSTDSGNVLPLRLYADNREEYIEFIYSIPNDGYMANMEININGLDKVMDASEDLFELSWGIWAPVKEKNAENERNTTTAYFKYKDESPDYISEASFDTEKLEATIEWVSFKQQFFSAAIISSKGFSKLNAQVKTEEVDDPAYTQALSTQLSLGFDNEKSFPISFYFGPNHHQTLADLDLQLEEQINLGWGIFGWVNEFFVIPIFNFLDNNTSLNYGIIILVLTIMIKMILFPLTYKNYVSSAKMKALKPEIEEINEKHKDDDAIKKQQATMALYKRAGVNPMAGCIPMVLQMPILYAMFRFFPASIELRQESFLWAEDLSTYDSIYNLGFEIPFYGDHISLFTLLMATSTFFYTKYNTQMSGSSAQMPQMKMMVYMMPVMLLVFFNSFSAGLSYYYLTANIISIAQQLVIKKWFIDEDAIRAKINENKKKPRSQKKSGFQKRMEEMAKKRGYKMPK